MPPKKGGTPTVAYVAKCSKCTKKHGPPLHEVCLALLATDLDNQSEGVNPDDRDSDDNHPDDQLGNEENLLGTASGGPSGQAGNHAVTQVVTQDTASGSPSGQAGNNAVFQGTTIGGPGGQAGSNVVSQRDDVVAAQLASIASAINILASRYEATRSELGELRAEVAATRALPRAPAAVQAASASVSDATFIPSVASLRGDPVLAAQADQLVEDLGAHTSGNGPSLSNVKRGLVRSGGDLAPLVKTPWPQDHIVGSGSKNKVYYEDLSIFEWSNGYMAIIQNETNPKIARLMMAHFRTLMEDAVSHGWEAVKYAHKDILMRLEMGEFTWYDELTMAEKRRSALTRASKPKDSVSANYSNRGFSQGRGNGKQYGARSGNKKLVKSCVYYNNNVCSKKGDHEEANVFYRHNCSHCMAVDHTIKECGFLTAIM
jgi:hypothetical protein